VKVPYRFYSPSLRSSFLVFRLEGFDLPLFPTCPFCLEQGRIASTSAELSVLLEQFSRVGV